MLDINLIRENPEQVKEGVKKKGVDPKLVDRFLQFDEKWREEMSALDNLRAEQNELSKKIAEQKKEEFLSRAQVLKKQISKIEKEKLKFKEKRSETLSQLPNLPFEDIVVGENESDNKVVEEAGDKPDFNFIPKNYMELGEKLNLINTKKAAEVAGSRFGYLIGDAAVMEFALIRLAFDVLLENDFIPIVPPAMMHPEIMRKMGKGKFIDEKDVFYVNDDDLYLIGSSEHSIGPFHMNEKFEEKDLPVKYAGFSTCFRREAGSYGKDTRGILRVHQFDKVEMFVFSHPDKSEEMQKEMVSIQKKLMHKLNIPYRLVEICTGDMGWGDAKQYDIEAWFPSENKYRETHSCSNTTDFQARGVNTKFQPESGGKPKLVHMLNGTAFAIGRTLIAIIENNQTEKGTIKIPEALQEYLGKSEIK